MDAVFLEPTVFITKLVISTYLRNTPSSALNDAWWKNLTVKSAAKALLILYDCTAINGVAISQLCYDLTCNICNDNSKFGFIVHLTLIHVSMMVSKWESLSVESVSHSAEDLISIMDKTTKKHYCNIITVQW